VMSVGGGGDAGGDGLATTGGWAFFGSFLMRNAGLGASVRMTKGYSISLGRTTPPGHESRANLPIFY